MKRCPRHTLERKEQDAEHHLQFGPMCVRKLQVIYFYMYSDKDLGDRLLAVICLRGGDYNGSDGDGVFTLHSIPVNCLDSKKIE